MSGRSKSGGVPERLNAGGPKSDPGSAGSGGKAAPRSAGLYNLADDLAESRNLAAGHPARVEEMAPSLNQIREPGRSR